MTAPLTLLVKDWVKEHNERLKKEGEFSRSLGGLDANDLRLTLQLVARRAQERSTQSKQAVIIQRSDFYGALDDIGRGEATPSVVKHLTWTAGMLLDLAEQAPGAIASPEPGRFRFLHLSFQEYLAACDMLYRPGTPNARPRKVGAARCGMNARFLMPLSRRSCRNPDCGPTCCAWPWTNCWPKAACLRPGNCWPSVAGPIRKAAKLIWEECWPCRLRWMLAFSGRCHRGRSNRIFARSIALPKRLLRIIQGRAILAFRPGSATSPADCWAMAPFPATIYVMASASGMTCPPSPGMKVIPDDGEFIYQKDERRTEPNFWIAKYPITYAQYRAFLEAEDGFDNLEWWRGLAAPEEDRRRPGEQRFPYWNHPAENVSWYDAVAFCRWLTAKVKAEVEVKAEGWEMLLPPGLARGQDWKITLPTEWQWEKTARGHDGRKFPWGKEYVSGNANIDETYGTKVGPHYLQKTSAVGMYPHEKPEQSPYGVADLSGNVWEWCLNEYEKPERIQEEGDAYRVLRGGSWYVV